MRTVVTDLGDLVFGSALLFGFLIVFFEWAERRREGRAEKSMLDQIEREYRTWTHLGRF